VIFALVIKTASFKLKPLSLNIKAVKSIGKGISYNSNVLAPLYLGSLVALYNNCNPWSRVQKEASSSLNDISISSCFISGKNSPIWSAKTLTNSNMKGSLVSKM
jgi:hypothetical protein